MGKQTFNKKTASIRTRTRTRTRTRAHARAHTHTQGAHLECSPGGRKHGLTGCVSVCVRPAGASTG